MTNSAVSRFSTGGLLSILVLCLLAFAPVSAIAQDDLVVLKRVSPDYPRRAAMAGIEGSVTMQFTINSDGTVSDVQVIDAEPRRVFDRAAVAAISQWQFEPFRVGGDTVSREASMSIDFQL